MKINTAYGLALIVGTVGAIVAMAFNQACAKVFVVGTSLAIILWSITLSRFGVLERRIGITGWFISLAALFGLLSGHVQMSAHGFGFIVLLQAVWAIALGVSMLRADRDVAVVTPDPVRM
jgi:hypothetical protein